MEKNVDKEIFLLYFFLQLTYVRDNFGRVKINYFYGLN